MTVNNTVATKNVPNVIGVLRGSVEPDRYEAQHVKEEPVTPPQPHSVLPGMSSSEGTETPGGQVPPTRGR